MIKFKYNFLFGAAAVALFALNSAAQATDWVLYEDESTDEALVINNGGAHDGEQHICQDEDGNVGATKDSQGGRICSTAKGSSRQFYVLVDQQPPLSPSEDSSDEGAGSDLMDSVSQGFHYEFSEEDVDEMYAALATTNAWQKALEAEASQPEYGVKKKKKGKITKKQGKKKKQFFSKVFGSK